MNWERFRILILIATTVSIFGVLCKLILFARSWERKTTKFVFPKTIDLPRWQQKTSNFIITPLAKNPDYISGESYHYIHKNSYIDFIDIEMGYLAYSNGDVQSLLKQYIANNLDFRNINPVVRHRPEIGFYGLFVHKGKAYLSACINPQGGSTFNAQQFLQNQIKPDVLSSRFLPWLFSGEKLRDQRCLLTKLSVPLNDSSPNNAYSTLDQAWIDWYRWWRPRFPNP